MKHDCWFCFCYKWCGGLLVVNDAHSLFYIIDETVKTFQSNPLKNHIWPQFWVNVVPLGDDSATSTPKLHICRNDWVRAAVELAVAAMLNWVDQLFCPIFTWLFLGNFANRVYKVISFAPPPAFKSFGIFVKDQSRWSFLSIEFIFQFTQLKWVWASVWTHPGLNSAAPLLPLSSSSSLSFSPPHWLNEQLRQLDPDPRTTFFGFH